MRLSRIMLSGALFGASAIGGGFLYAAATSPKSEGDAAIFSTEPLHAFATLSPTSLPDSPVASNVMERLGNAKIYDAISVDGVTAYLASTADGRICAVVHEADTFGLGCGSIDDVAAGRVVLRLQFKDSDPSVFVGVASNDVTTAHAGGASATAANNMWVLVADSKQQEVTMSGDGKSLTVDLGPSGSVAEGPAPTGS